MYTKIIAKKVDGWFILHREYRPEMMLGNFLPFIMEYYVIIEGDYAS